MTAKVHKFFKALSKLAEAMERFAESEGSDLYEMARDSLIQRFEFTYELFWKCSKERLSGMHELDTASPKATFLEAFNVGDISVEEHKKLLAMLSDRNSTSHAYDEDLADQIAQSVQSYYELMEKLANRMFM